MFQLQLATQQGRTQTVGRPTLPEHGSSQPARTPARNPTRHRASRMFTKQRWSWQIRLVFLMWQ